MLAEDRFRQTLRRIVGAVMSQRADDALSIIRRPPTDEERALHERLITEIPSMDDDTRARVISVIARTAADEVLAELQAQRRAEAEARRAKADTPRPHRKRLQQVVATASPGVVAV